MRSTCLITSGCLLMLILAGSCEPQKTPASLTSFQIPTQEKDPAVWGQKYPSHYDSYLANAETQNVYGKYRGDQQSRLSSWPFQLILLDGWGMGVEYNEPQGHTEALKDQLAIAASRRKAGGLCLTCKTPYAPQLKATLGESYFKKSYEEVYAFIPEQHNKLGIVCADCHEPETMALRLSRWTLIAALQQIGKDTKKLTHQEMRSLVCAQCHVTYAIPKDTENHSSGLLFPWKYGTWGNITIEAVIQQIKTENLREWKHTVTNQKLGHLRHPEFELFSAPGSIHWAAGVACADCHMPYQRVGKEKISSHHWESPMKKNMIACAQCHNQSAEWIQQQVFNIQDRVNHLFTKAGYAAAQAALTIQSAEQLPAAAPLLQTAKEKYAEAYYRVTWIGAENSMGFHNPPEALRVLGDALDYARQAEAAAREAIIQAQGQLPVLNIAEIDRIVSEKYRSTDGKTLFLPQALRKAALLQ